MTNDQIILIAIAAGVLLLLVPPVVSYNRFVSQRNLIRDSWAGVDTELRRRYDLIPTLVKTVQGYAEHERALLEELTRARAAAVAANGPPSTQEGPENALVAALRQLFVSVEAYPDLKASANFLELQRELASTEDRLAAARRFYNGNVRDYNRRVQSVPSNIVASLFKFRLAQFFEIEEVARATPSTAT